MNPELLRNLWLQFSPARLVAAPLIIGAVLALTALGADGDWVIVGQAAHFGFAVIAYLWGTRRAVSVLTDEIVAGTWDGQRMSSIGPWRMTWGKVIGGAAYVWYCASLCLLVYAVAQVRSGRSAELPLQLSLDLSGALLVQVIALLLALILVRKGHRIGRRSVAFAQGGALLVALLGVTEALLPSFLEWFDVAGERTSWFGMAFSVSEFTLLTQLLFLAWAIVGAYRLMSSELQVRQYPWMWTSFSLFLIAYYQGFVLAGWSGGHFPRVLAALAVAVPLVYVAVFAQTNEVVRYRWLLHHLGTRTARNALSLTPLWVPSMVLAAGLAIAAGLLAGDEPELMRLVERPMTGRLDAGVWAGGLPSAIALILFMLRDLGLVLFLNFAARPKAPDLTAVVYLVVLYVVCGGLVVAAGAGSLLAVFLPGAGTDPLLVVIAPLVQVALVAVLLLRRWRWHARALQLRPAA